MEAMAELKNMGTHEQLEYFRNKMIQAANHLGIHHPQVLDYSQKIDETHNKIMMLKNDQK